MSDTEKMPEGRSTNLDELIEELLKLQKAGHKGDVFLVHNPLADRGVAQLGGWLVGEGPTDFTAPIYLLSQQYMNTHVTVRKS